MAIQKRIRPNQEQVNKPDFLEARNVHAFSVKNQGSAVVKYGFERNNCNSVLRPGEIEEHPAFESTYHFNLYVEFQGTGEKNCLVTFYAESNEEEPIV